MWGRGGVPLSPPLFLAAGREASQDEQGACALLCTQLNAALGERPVTHREVQGNESDEFMEYFPRGVTYQVRGLGTPRVPGGCWASHMGAWATPVGVWASQTGAAHPWWVRRMPPVFPPPLSLPTKHVASLLGAAHPQCSASPLGAQNLP